MLLFTEFLTVKVINDKIIIEETQHVHLPPLHNCVDRSKSASGAVCANLFSSKHLLLAWIRSPSSHPQQTHACHISYPCVCKQCVFTPTQWDVLAHLWVRTSLWASSWSNMRNIIKKPLSSLEGYEGKNKVNTSRACGEGNNSLILNVLNDCYIST